MLRRRGLLSWIVLCTVGAYAFTLCSAVYAQDPERLKRSLAVGSWGGWDTRPFLSRFFPVLACTLVLGAWVMGRRGPFGSERWAPLFETPSRRLTLVTLPLALSPFALLQDEVSRRPSLVALCVGLSLAFGVFIAHQGAENPGPSGPEESPRRRWLREHGAMLGVIALHAVLFARLTITRDRALWSATVDLGIFKEALWNTLHGRPMHSATVGYSFLGEHFAPVLFALAPLYALSPTSDCLLVVQSLAVSVSAWPIYLLGRELGLGRALATALGCAMIFAPAVENALLYDFHMDLLAVPAMAWLVLASHRKKWLQAAVAVALMVSTKEDMFVPVVGVLLGAALTTEGKDRRKPVALALLAVIWCVVAAVVLIPRFGPPRGVPVYMEEVNEPGVAYKFLRNYRHLSAGPVRLLLAEPFRWVLYALSDARLTTLLSLVLPVGLMPFFAGRRLGLLAPAAIVLLSDNPEVVALRYHYGAIQHPGVYAAAVYGAARWIERSSRPESLRSALTAMVVGAGCVMAWMHPSSVASEVHNTDARAVTRHTRVVQRMVEQVPAGARVSSTSFGGPRFSNRRWVGLFPTKAAVSDWALVDMQRPPWPAQPAQRNEFILAMLRSSWAAVDWEDGAVLFRRSGGDASRNEEAARDLFARRQYEVEGTEWTEFPGCSERDPRASDGWARVVRPTDPRAPGWMVFGPFIKLPPGRYVARFRLRAERGMGHQIGAVDVHASPEVVLATRRLTPRDFPDPGWRVIPLLFEVIAQDNIEFRVFTAHRWLLGADSISLAVDGDEASVVHAMLHPR